MQRRIAERVAQWGSGLPRGSRVARESTGNACRASPLPEAAPSPNRPLLRRRSSEALQGAEVISSGRTHAGPAPLLPLRPRLLPSLQKAWDVQGTDPES